MTRKAGMALTRAALDIGEPELWLSLTLDDGANVMARVRVDQENKQVQVLVPGVAEDVEFDPATVTAYTRMSVVDAEWVERTRVNTLKVNDADRRLRIVAAAADQLDEKVPTIDTLDPAQRAAFLDSIVEQLRDALEPTKDGVV